MNCTSAFAADLFFFINSHFNVKYEVILKVKDLQADICVDSNIV